MMIVRTNMNDGPSQWLTALFLVISMTAVVGTALAFEHFGGFIPCAMCLLQREPYYIGIPIAVIAGLSAYSRWPGCVSRGLLAVIGLLMVYGFVLSVQHSGVEWGWWEGPADCAAGAATLPTDAGSLLGTLDAQRAPACNEAAGRFLGLSFAGWNAVATAALSLVAFYGATKDAD